MAASTQRVLMLLALALTGALLALGACGGDDEDDEPEAAATADAPEATTDDPADEDKKAENDDDKRGDDSARGGEETPDEPAVPQTTRAEFVRAADQICKAANEEFQRQIVKAAKEAAESGDGSTEAFNPYSGGYVDLFRDSADEIAALPQPSAGPSPDAFLATQRDYADLIERAGEEFEGMTSGSFDESDQARLADLTDDLRRTTLDLRSLAREQGFKVCGRAG